MTNPTNDIQILRDQFRHHLEAFFSELKLAPPYDTVEKALGQLTHSLKMLPHEELKKVSFNTTLQWNLYQQVFRDSGLNLKHRGIIIGLIRNNQTSHLQDLYQRFLQAYTSEMP